MDIYRWELFRIQKDNILGGQLLTVVTIHVRHSCHSALVRVTGSVKIPLDIKVFLTCPELVGNALRRPTTTLRCIILKIPRDKARFPVLTICPNISYVALGASIVPQSIRG